MQLLLSQRLNSYKVPKPKQICVQNIEDTEETLETVRYRLAQEDEAHTRLNSYKVPKPKQIYVQNIEDTEETLETVRYRLAQEDEAHTAGNPG
ncbi:hypothetical protein ElyMa_001986400 [Elysia marginata]|uniref:Uncharacterized protein n=1 Tax=Elysia marginata TaxID=1093978 RepID=A0AAV4F0V0_9GAST|nr:hypothetical protein ElyMa_001986400 [Elysia marginata]